MSNRIPARTAKGRDVLLDRTIELDSKLRTVLAQCDGKRDEEQINARFGAIVDVGQAIAALLAQGLIEVPMPAATASPTAPAAVSAAPAPVAPARPTTPAARPITAPALLTPMAPPAVPAPPVTPAPIAGPAVAAEDDPYAEWFPASMRASKDEAA